MQREKIILVAGATGKQGGAVARHLLQAGFKVRALTRTPDSDRAKQLQRQGAEIAIGNLDDRDSLARAVEGVGGVFSVQNYWEPGVGYEGEVRQGRNLADAAKQAGVKHYVQSTMADAASFQGVEHFESKAEIEYYVNHIGLLRTFIGTVYFMDNLLDPKMGGPMTFPVLAGSLRPNTPFHMVAVDDIGAIVTAVFQNPAQFIGTKINVTGDILTVSQMKAVYRQVTGKQPRPFSIPAWLLRIMNKEFAQQLHWHNQIGWTFGSEQAKRIHPALLNFEQFIRTHIPRGL